MLTGQSFGEEAEPLEHRAVAKLVGDIQKFAARCIFAFEIRRKAIRDMTDAAADRRIIEHVDDRLRRTADIDPDRSAPDRAHGEQHFRPDMLEGEGNALDRLFLLAYRPRREHAGAAEQLLGQAPMFGGAPSADAGGAEQLRHDHPGIFEHLFLAERRDRHRRVEAATQASHPALIVPACEQLGGGLTLDAQDTADIIDRHDFPCAAQHLTELHAAFGHGGGDGRHVSNYLSEIL